MEGQRKEEEARVMQGKGGDDDDRKGEVEEWGAVEWKVRCNDEVIGWTGGRWGMAAEQQEAEEQVAVEQKVRYERMAGRRMGQLLQGAAN